MWATLAGVTIMSSFVTGLALGAKLSGEKGFSNEGFLAGYSSAKAKLEKSGMFPLSSAKISALSGRVTSVEKNSITVTDISISGNPLEYFGPASRTIAVSDETLIVRLVPLSAEEMSSSAKAFQDSLKSGGSPIPPSPFREEAVGIAEVKEGMIITAIAEKGILDAGEINASKISFQ
jgi:hypothetical protein